MIQEIIKEAGSIALSHYRKVEPSMKGNRTYVTAADLAVQAFIVEQLEKHFPEDGIIGEEEGQRKEARSGNRQWIVDPIDGTASFVGGFPVWGMAIGLIEDGKEKEGYFYMPVIDQMYHTEGGSVFMNGTRVQMKKVRPLHNETLVFVTTVSHRTRRIAANFPGQINCFGSGAAHLSYLASGGVDAVWLEGVFPWDIAGGIAMVRQNGGKVVLADGTDFDISMWLGGEVVPFPIYAGRPEMLEMLFEYL